MADGLFLFFSDINCMKKIFAFLVLVLTATATMASNSILAKLIKADYEEKADSLTNAFIKEFMNTSKGTFWVTPRGTGSSNTYIYWQQAHAIDVIIYAYERHKEAGNGGYMGLYKRYIEKWYESRGNNYSNGPTGFENPYTDDMCWIALTLLRMGEVLDNTTYSQTAKKLFDNAIMSRAKEDEKGLWLPWNDSEGSGPNACTLSPACLIAAKLYMEHGTEKYLEYAKKFYAYMQAHITKSDGRVEEPPLTYTQGTFGEACRLLYHITGDFTYKNKAATYISYAFTSGRCTSNGLLRHEGTSMDQSIFKAVLIPYAVNFCLDEEMGFTTRRSVVTALLKNADALWKNLDKEAYPKMYCPYYWGQAYNNSEAASMGAMASGASLLENVARMCRELTAGTGIEMPIAAPGKKIGSVYSIDGKAMRHGTTDTKGLPSGIYVVNGKKVLEK